ncbi:YqgE/AlgH family protein [Cruoricaptor ignavus]|uniref:YqgE/AlgH family protein n=1 Tax=Cruoricaptor ignavus TaxID=1118202 RepID=UPI00370D1EDD
MEFSYKGKILISAPDLSGDIFSRAVVLMIDHNEQGAFGLILNRRNDEISAHMRQIFGFDVAVYEGGPMENDKIFFIVRGVPLTEAFLKVDENYYLTEDVEAIAAEIISGRLNTEDVKIFSGYSGWAAMQLESEIARRAWTVVEVFNMDYTAPNDQTLWKHIMQNLGGEFLLYANAPENVMMN